MRVPLRKSAGARTHLASVSELSSGFCAQLSDDGADSKEVERDRESDGGPRTGWILVRMGFVLTGRVKTE
jgi:hypothetical protein